MFCKICGRELTMVERVVFGNKCEKCWVGSLCEEPRVGERLYL